MKNKIPIIVIVVICIAAIFALFGGRGYKSVIKAYAKAYLHSDAKKLVSLLPDGRVQQLIDDWYGEEEKIVSEVQKNLDNLIRSLKSEIDDNMKVSYKVISVYDYTGDDLEHLKQDYFKKCGEKVTKGKEVVLEFNATDKNLSCTQKTKFIIVKIGRSWYLTSTGHVSSADIYTSRQYVN